MRAVVSLRPIWFGGAFVDLKSLYRARAFRTVRGSQGMDGLGYMFSRFITLNHRLKLFMVSIRESGSHFGSEVRAYSGRVMGDEDDRCQCVFHGRKRPCLMTRDSNKHL